MKYSTDTQHVYDLKFTIDNSMFLELFNSYKTMQVYEANVLNQDGELEIINYYTEDDYRHYLSFAHDKDEIEVIVSTFLRQKQKKMYYDPLFQR